jgi:LuxR family maltose regulon positive regulatory protein
MSQGPGLAGQVATPNGDPLMAAKFLIPTLRPRTVKRERLLSVVSRGVGGPLTLISAPAGSGKTALLSSWVAADRSPGPVLWVGLDEEDSQPGIFWSYVRAGLAREGLRGADVAAPARPDTVEQALLVRLAAGLFERTEPIVVILDNAEVLAGSAVPNQINYLLSHAGPLLRLVISGRVDLPFPVHRYRLAATVTEIGFGELAFAGPEVDALLAAHAIDLPREAVQAAEEATRGWAAGLVLAAPVPQGIGDAGEVRGPTDGDLDGVSGYFVSEVLGTQPPAVQNFLMRTSVVRQVWPDLAVALTARADAARVLAELARGNALLVAGGVERPWYEQPPLVRDLLRRQLHEKDSDSVGRLHQCAARWLAAQGMVTEAVDHALAAGDWRQAAMLVVECRGMGRMLLGSSADSLVTRFADMPVDVTSPEGAVVHACVALAGRDTELCCKYLASARELVLDGSSHHTQALELAISAVEAMCAHARGHVDGTLSAITAAQAILTDVRAQTGSAPVQELRTLLLATKGSTLIRAGDLERAGGALVEGLQAAEETGCDDLRVRCLGELALVAVLRGELHRAARFARRAETIAAGCRLPVEDRPPAAAVALAWVHAEAYEPGTARRHVDRAARSRLIGAEPVPSGLLALVRVRLGRADGDLDAAMIALEQVPSCPPGAPLPEWLRSLLMAAGVVARLAGGALDVDEDGLRAAAPHCAHCGMALALTTLARGHGEDAVARVNDLLRRTDLAADLRVEGELLLCEGELARERREPARSALERALALAAAQTLRRPFIEASPRLRGFLRRERDLVGQHEWLTGGAVAAQAPGTLAAANAVGTAGLVEALTEREGEVLLHMAMLLSTDEIARKMFISVNTVKTHIRGIFRKLSVSRRNDAIRRARDLGLV